MSTDLSTAQADHDFNEIVETLSGGLGSKPGIQGVEKAVHQPLVEYVTLEGISPDAEIVGGVNLANLERRNTDELEDLCRNIYFGLRKVLEERYGEDNYKSHELALSGVRELSNSLASHEYLGYLHGESVEEIGADENPFEQVYQEILTCGAETEDKGHAQTTFRLFELRDAEWTEMAEELAPNYNYSVNVPVEDS